MKLISRGEDPLPKVRMKVIDFSRVRNIEDIKDVLSHLSPVIWDDGSERFDGIRRFLVDRPKW